MATSSIVNDGSFNFKGIKIGDVNCSALNDLPPCEEEINILVEDKAYRANDVFTVALLTENFEDIAAYQFALRFDATKLEYQSLQQGDLNRGANPDNFKLPTLGSGSSSPSNNGLIRTLWLYNDATKPAYTVMDTTLTDTSSLFIVEFKALEDIPALSDVMNIQVEDFPAEAWSDGADCAHNVTMEFVPDGYAGSRSSKQSDHPAFVGTNKIRVHPNPTSGNLVFEITTDIISENTILIYSPTGQEVLRKRVFLDKGNNTIPMENMHSWSNGLYFYTITNSSGVTNSGKFVKN